MAQQQLAVFSTVAISDTAATAGTVMARDSSGDSALRRLSLAGLLLNGYLTLNSTAVSTNATLDNTVCIVYADATSGSITLTLPAVAVSTGFTYFIQKRNSANSVILDGNASETVNGATTYTISTQYAAAIIHCDGSTWSVLAIK